MNTVLIAVLAYAALGLGYFFYARLIDKKLVGPEPNRPTPAYMQRDGIDYEPANPLVLFGHHFSSIAGAGPIIGPVLALAAYGWLPVVLWIVLGSLFMGGVHDYLALMISVRNKGLTISQITEVALGKRARNVFGSFLWLALVLVVCVFGASAANVFVKKPQLVLPTFMLIPIAMGFGLLLKKGRLHLVPATILGVGANFLMVYLGYLLPLPMPEIALGGLVIHPATTWFVILMSYGFLASGLPVWFLLQPRDYLVIYNLFIGLFLGIVAIFAAAHPVHAPVFLHAIDPKQGPIWPMLFVLVACSAISGFHCLVASGTSSKQLANEKHGKRIGYGGMLMEAVLGIMTTLVVAGGLYWSRTTAPAGVASDRIFLDILGGKGGWILAFGQGYGYTVSALPLLTPVAGALLGMFILKSFIMTTLDTAARLGRFIISEVAGDYVPPLKNRWLASAITVVAASGLAVGNSWQKIWPVFGAANQLVAALALTVITAYLVGVRKPAWYTGLPAVFMSLTTVAALAIQVNKYLLEPESRNFLLGGVALLLIVLALVLAYEAVKRLASGKRLEERKEYALLATPEQVGAPCAWCGEITTENESVVVCSECGLVYHAACWVKNSGCSNPECKAYAGAGGSSQPPSETASSPAK